MCVVISIRSSCRRLTLRNVRWPQLRGDTLVKGVEWVKHRLPRSFARIPETVGCGFRLAFSSAVGGISPYSHIVLDISANQSKGHADIVPLTKESAMSTAQTLPTVFSGSSSTWEGSLYAFLAEKQRRSGSNRTPDSYYRTLRHFFGSLQKSPDQVSPQDVFSFAHGVGLSGREPSPVTVGARLSCISSFFKFLIQHSIYVKANPCDPVERPKPRPGAPSGLSASQMQQLLQVIPDTTSRAEARPRHRPHSRSHRQTQVRGHQPDRRRHRLRRIRRLLPLYRQGRCARPS